MISKKFIRISTALATYSAVIALTASCVTTGSQLGEADTDKDGALDISELEEALTQSVFDVGDTNKDGKISIEEVRKADPERPDSKFKTDDKDGSGYLSYEELKVIVDKENSFDELLTRIDENKNGVVDPKEAGRLRKAITAAERDDNLTPLERYFDQ
tara:strand:- start:122 stop:595 length:474 start_codon:yes stop_codon:yes gene_type:complete